MVGDKGSLDSRVLLAKEDIPSLSPGFHGVPIDMLLYINSSLEKTDGISTRLQAVYDIVSLSSFDIPAYYLGSNPSRLTIPTQIGEIYIPAGSNFKETFDGFLRKQKATSVIGFICVADIGTHLIDIKNTLLNCPQMGSVFIGVDGSFNVNNEPDGRPVEERNMLNLVGRTAFVSDDQTLAYFVRVLPFYLPPSEVTSDAPMTFCLSTTNPISSCFATEASLRLVDGLSRKQARQELMLDINGMDKDLRNVLSDPNAKLVHLAANEGYFREENIGSWLTHGQYRSSIDSILKFSQTLSRVSVSANGEIWLTVPPVCVELINRLELPGIHILPSPRLPEREYLRWMLANDLVVHRTIQTNTFARAIRAGATSAVWTMPTRGWMDAEELDQACAQKYGFIHHTLETEEAKVIDDMTQLIFGDVSGYTARLREASDECLRDKSTNFYTVSKRLLGLVD